MSVIAGLIALGTILVFLETVLIGGVWCVMGIACYVWSIWTAYDSYGAAAAVFTGIVCAAMCAAAFLVWLYVIPKTSIGKKLYLNSSQDGRTPSQNLEAFVGKTAVALSPLAPCGKVEVDGAVCDARCETSYAHTGDKLVVTNANSFELIVNKI